MKVRVIFHLSFAVLLLFSNTVFAVCGATVPWRSKNDVNCDRLEFFEVDGTCCTLYQVYLHNIPEEWQPRPGETTFNPFAVFKTQLQNSLRSIALVSGTNMGFNITEIENDFGCNWPTAVGVIDVSADMSALSGENHDELAFSDWSTGETGQIMATTITVHLGSDRFQGSEAENSLEYVLMHELGHLIGMDHNTSDNTVMQAVFDQNLLVPLLPEMRWAEQERSSIRLVYQETEKLICRPSPSFIFSVSVVESGLVGGYATINLSTEFEEEMSFIKYSYSSSASPADSEFVYLGQADFDNYYFGSSYSFETGVPLGGGGKFLVELFNDNSSVESSVILDNNINVIGSQSVPDYASMRVSNFNRISGGYWRDVASGIRAVPAVGEPAVDSGEYLVIAYFDFVTSVAPICDYWESVAGIDVSLISVDGSIDSANSIKNYIAAANQAGTLEMIWLVGSPREPKGAVASYCYVPTDYTYFDYFYADSGDFGYMEYSVGRLPAKNSDEVVFYVNKELNYHWDTFWGGRKNPNLFGQQLVVSIPEVGRNFDQSTWGEMEWQTIINAENALDYVRLNSGLAQSGIHYLDMTELPGYGVSQEQSRSAFISAFGPYILSGQHVVHSYSSHNGSGNQYGVLDLGDWIGCTTITDNFRTFWRPCQTFWIHPSCFSASIFCNPGYVGGTEGSIQSIQAFELFNTQGLSIFGSMERSWVSTSGDLVGELSTMIYDNDARYGRPKSVGTVWRDAFNHVMESSNSFPRGLGHYGILGDPMLFVRDVFDMASEAIVGPNHQLSVSVHPSPFNGRTEIVLAGVKAGGGVVRVFDVRGIRIREMPIEDRAVGRVCFPWDGRDGGGRPVPSGVYFVRVDNAGLNYTQKIAFLK